MELIEGPIYWDLKRDQDGHRTYTIRHRVKGDIGEGPAAALQCPGLPQAGDAWIVENDVDLWAWFRLDAKVTAAVDDEPCPHFIVEQTASTLPTSRCSDGQIEDPLLEPDQVSGGITKYTVEADTDVFGLSITNSAWEQIRGPQNEWEVSRNVIRITQNVPDLEESLWMPMNDTLNDAPLWGFPTRSIRLTISAWEKKYYGLCEFYYTRTLELEPWVVEDPENPGSLLSGWDRDILDEGTKALNGRWNQDGEWELIDIAGGPPDPLNPSHFKRLTDREGNPMTVLLKDGVPINAEIPCFTRTGSVVADGLVVSMESTDSIEVGMTVEGPGIADGTTVTLVVEDELIEISEVATETVSQASLMFCDLAGGSERGFIHVAYYKASNFLLLGVPLTL